MVRVAAAVAVVILGAKQRAHSIRVATSSADAGLVGGDLPGSGMV